MEKQALNRIKVMLTEHMLTEACAYYRDKKPVIFARGFTNFQKRTYPQPVSYTHLTLPTICSV